MLGQLMASLDTRRTDLLLQFIIAKAGESDDWRDRELGPIHLLKYCYIADLAFAERHAGQPLTGAEWQFYHFGPWQPAVLDRIEPALAAIHANVKRITGQYEGDFVRYSVPADQKQQVIDATSRELPLGVIGAVERALREYGSDTGSLLNYVYLTRPMLRAAPGELLDLRADADEARHAAAEGTMAQPGKRQQRIRNQAMAALKKTLAERLRSPRHAHSPTPAPRYDEVFAAGAEWLDSIAGEAVSPSRGDLAIDDSLWRSDQRTERDVP